MAAGVTNTFWTVRDLVEMIDTQMKTLMCSLVVALSGTLAFAQTSPKKDFEAAKQEYEQSSRDETARVAYVTKLAQIKERLLREQNEQADNLKRAINSECQKHPTPKDVDSKKLKQLIVGKWASPRHTYVYLANGKCGMEGGALGNSWRIQGNQLIQGDSSGPIILLTHEYFIYSAGPGDSVAFHSRVKD
jgi:hypothetical protein